jgi:hypothetical protein
MRLALACPLLVGLAAISGAHAQVAEDPWYAGASLGWTKVSNLYRVSNEAARNDDTVRAVSVMAGAQTRLGRQRIKLDARLSQNDYSKNSDLGNLSYSGSGGLDWAIGSRISGTLSASSSRNLAPFNPGNTPITEKKNIERNDRARLYARYGLAGLWSVDGGFTAVRRDFSIVEYNRYDFSQTSFDLGLRWQPGPELSLRLGGRQADGKAPRYVTTANGSFLADRWKRKDVDASISWTPSLENQLTLRISNGTARHTEAAARDFKGSSGDLSWKWAPTARIFVTAQLSRETGDDTREINFGPITLLNSYSRVSDTAQLQLVYAVSAKVSLDLSVSEARRSLSDERFGGIVEGKDRTRSAGLGVRWAMARNGSLGCQWNTDRRQGAAGFSLPYTASSVGCSAQYMLR